MRTVGYVLLALAMLGSVLPAPLAGADEHTPHPTVEYPTLWAHAFDDPSCCEYWMSAYYEDPAGTGTNPGGNPATGQSWELPFEPGLLGAVHFDPDTAVTMVAFIGGSASNGVVEVTSQLLSGETVVAEGDAEAMTPFVVRRARQNLRTRP